MGILYVSLAAFGGGIISALLGWMESGENFIARKFGASVLRALLAGGAFAATYSIVGGVSLVDIVIALLAGAGVDVVLHRIAGSIK
jgi:hypothetical protein